MYFCCYNYIPLLANYVIDLPLNEYLCQNVKPLHNYPTLENDNLHNLKDGNIIFVKTNFLYPFLTYILPKINVKIILISGVSDCEIDDVYTPFLNDDKIIKFIGVNISIQNHPKINKILVGFQEPSRKNGEQENLYKMHNSKIDFNMKKNRLLITYCNNTHNSRENIITKFYNDKFINFTDFAGKMDFNDYLTNINNYKFVLCPR